MENYKILAARFIIEIEQKNPPLNRIFSINDKGKRVLNDKTKAVKLVKNEIKNLLSRYGKNTVKNILGVYNKELKINGLDMYIEIFKTTFMPFYIEINNAYKMDLERKTNNATLLKNGNELIKLAYNFIQSYDYIKITIGLAILTGRRTSEILKTANFEFIDSSHVFFTGQIKQNDNLGYKIPVLFDAKIIIESLEKLRIMKSYNSIEEVNFREASVLNKSVKQLLKKWSKTLKMHDLRRVYAFVCYHYVFNKEAKENGRQTFDGYTMEILGHKIIKSGESYRILEVEM